MDDEEKDMSKFVGLQNRSNSCWLDTLVQCINSLPQRLYLLDERKKNTQCKVTSALLNVISKMHYSSNKSFHPSELYKAMLQDEYNLTAGEQQDIQEMFTFLCSTGIQNMNDIIASQFQTGFQFRKTCKNCGMYEDNSPETPTTILVPVLHGIQDLKRSIENTMIDHISIHCSYCNDVTDHTRSGKFVFLPQISVYNLQANTQKNHSKVLLPLEIELTGNTLCRYSLHACALHHGMHIHNGHYTAVIFDNGRVIEIDDHVVRNVTHNWIDIVQSTVYLAFYTKKYTSSTYSKQVDNYPYSGNDTDKRKKEDVSESMFREDDEGNERINMKETENILHLYDVSYKYRSVCNTRTVGYDLLGSDFKTLEYPVINNSCSLEKPGWLNDKIVDAYLLLLVRACSQKGICVHALNSFFYTRIRKVVMNDGNQKNLYDMISRSREMTDYEACDYIMLPINNRQHWTAVFVDIWSKPMFYYDPLGKGIQNFSVIKSFKVFFDVF